MDRDSTFTFKMILPEKDKSMGLKIPPTPPILYSIFGNTNWVAAHMKHSRINEIIAAVGRKDYIKIKIAWPGYPWDFMRVPLTLTRPGTKWVSRAELHLLVGEAYMDYFKKMKAQGVTSTIPEYAVGTPRTDLTRLTVVGLKYCGEDIFEAQVVPHEPYPEYDVGNPLYGRRAVPLFFE